MEHPQIETPPDEIVIWRYIDLPKFLLMLEHKALYFALFSEFEDKWEAVLDRELTASIAGQFTAASGQVIGLFQEFIKGIAVNCWYCGDDESVAMWRLYTSSEYGIAIRSSVRDFKRALAVSELDVYLGDVKYRDHTDAPSQTLATRSPRSRRYCKSAFATSTNVSYGQSRIYSLTFRMMPSPVRCSTRLFQSTADRSV